MIRTSSRYSSSTSRYSSISNDVYNVNSIDGNNKIVYI